MQKAGNNRMQHSVAIRAVNGGAEIGRQFQRMARDRNGEVWCVGASVDFDVLEHAAQRSG